MEDELIQLHFIVPMILLIVTIITASFVLIEKEHEDELRESEQYGETVFCKQCNKHINHPEMDSWCGKQNNPNCAWYVGQKGNECGIEENNPEQDERRN